jgi:hypothetical protein
VLVNVGQRAFEVFAVAGLTTLLDVRRAEPPWRPCLA